ncbi:5-formyltetrahydrofolate cyclo-ligase [Azospirillum halopraeferens]|uniref:5-formyltetrahydrofolate cyclo-ligase n=1 Tax=Azospirillum halopraeferens TaxID=34010 RepID=UPI00040EF9C0|nr:5-formyltetrahydrofolate cyclo-ligase [Azospirillum halopraeferens]
MSDPGEAKAAARLRARVLRDAITDPETCSRLARAVRDRVAAEVPLPDGPVAGYWPLGSELDVRPLLLHLVEGGRTAALPVSGPRGTPLRFRAWQGPDTPMHDGRYGIREPAECVPEVVPAVLLVPFLAFDRSGHRLGYGAGYYDRTLAGLRAAGRPALAVGVGFAAQEVGQVPHGPHDEPLDWIVTEREALRIGGTTTD